MSMSMRGAAGVDAVFQQLLDDAGRPFDDLAGGDLGDDSQGELMNAWPVNLGCDNHVGKNFLEKRG